jgi:hypothetical protein
MQTLSDMAQRIAAAHKRPDTDRLHRQLRNLAGAGRVKAQVSPGATRAQLFADSEIYPAAILAAALDAGFSGQDIETIDSTLRHGRRTAAVLSLNTADINLSVNLERIAAGEDWRLEIASVRNAFGELMASSDWVMVRPDGRFHVPERGAAGRMHDPDVVAVTYINVTALVRPLLDGAA